MKQSKVNNRNAFLWVFSVIRSKERWKGEKEDMLDELHESLEQTALPTCSWSWSLKSEGGTKQSWNHTSFCFTDEETEEDMLRGSVMSYS